MEMKNNKDDGIIDTIIIANSVSNDLRPAIMKTIKKLAEEIISYTEKNCGYHYLIEINSQLINLLMQDSFSIEDIHDILKKYEIDYII